MHFTPVLAAALLAASVTAAPASSKASGNGQANSDSNSNSNNGNGNGNSNSNSSSNANTNSNSSGNSASALDKVLQKIGIKASTNANSHGPTWEWPAIKPVNPNKALHSHSINWPKGCSSDLSVFVDWTTYKANGCNIGAWLEKEKTHDYAWWTSVDPTGAAMDEWTLCQNLGGNCASVFEARYASYITTADIDKLASIGINTLRIPTTYAAWIDVPGSQLHHGNQQSYLSTITQYAIQNYNMHIIVGLHSLPGGVNGLDIGEGFGRDEWFQNATNLQYSFDAISQILNFITASGHTNAFTIAPINEASDTHLAGFGSPAGLTANGTNWINTYINGVLKLVSEVDVRIPVMLQDCFQGESFWSPFYPAGTNLVIDSHFYWFAAAGAYANYIAPASCGEASAATDGKFPVFVGEWSLQTMYNNTFAGRKELYDTQRYAWQNYLSGSAFWNVWSDSPATVDGEGIEADYWSLLELIDQGVATAQTNSSYC